jgi:hypothetical protein
MGTAVGTGVGDGVGAGVGVGVGAAVGVGASVSVGAGVEVSTALDKTDSAVLLVPPLDSSSEQPVNRMVIARSRANSLDLLFIEIPPILVPVSQKAVVLIIIHPNENKVNL